MKKQDIWEGLAFDSLEELERAHRLLKNYGFNVKQETFFESICRNEILLQLQDSEFSEHLFNISTPDFEQLVEDILLDIYDNETLLDHLELTTQQSIYKTYVKRHVH